MTDIVIRQMEAADIPELAELEKKCFSVPWSENSLREELENELSDYIVAETDGIIAGYVGTQTVLDEADVMNLAVLPDYRRSGFGERLLREMLERLRRRNVSAVTLEVRRSNEPARRLYEKLGFTEIGCRKNYYYQPQEDALILRCRLKEEENK